MNMEQEHEVRVKKQFRELWRMITVLYLLEVALFVIVIMLEFKIGLLH